MAWPAKPPLRRWKRETYRGGVSDPFIVSSAAAHHEGRRTRHQFAHAIDMVPTVLDALELDPPQAIRGVTQSPIEGMSFRRRASMTPTRQRGTSPSTSRCSATARSITMDGGQSAPGRERRSPRRASASAPRSPSRSCSTSTPLRWAYHVAEDPAETTNVADANRALLIGMIGQWYVEVVEVPRVADRQPWHAALRRPAAADRGAARGLHLLPDAGHLAGGRGQHPESRAHHHRHCGTRRQAPKG